MIHLFVPGQPVAKARHKSSIMGKVIGKQYIHNYTPVKTRKYEDYIRTLAKQAMLMRSITRSPVSLDLVLSFEIPESWPAWKREAALTNNIGMTTKPDADNVTKAIKDALNKIVWHDDSQVVQLNVLKVYSKTPGVLISVTELSMSPAQITRKDQLKISGQGELAVTKDDIAA